MKVTVSIPDAVFSKAEAMARRLGTTRSELYARALDAYVGEPTSDQITDAMNAVIDAIDEPLDPAVQAQARRILKRVEW